MKKLFDSMRNAVGKLSCVAIHGPQYAEEKSIDISEECAFLIAAIQKIEQSHCEDAVSRQAVLEGLASIAKAKARSDAQKSMMGRTMFFVEKLPPVTTQPKIGHWKDLGYNDEWYGRCYTCSVCNAEMIGAENYCPNCGSYMKEDKK